MSFTTRLVVFLILHYSLQPPFSVDVSVAVVLGLDGGLLIGLGGGL